MATDQHTGKTVKKTAVKKEKNEAAPVEMKPAAKTATAKKAATKSAPKKKAEKKTAAKKTAAKKTAVQKGTPVNPIAENSAPAKAATKSSPAARRESKKIVFQLRFHTLFGQQIFITGDHPLLGDSDPLRAVPLQYFNEECWRVSLELEGEVSQRIRYHYILRNADGVYDHDAGSDKYIDPAQLQAREIVLIDTWNHAGFVENVFYTKAFTEVLLPSPRSAFSAIHGDHATHTWKVKAPLLGEGHTLCLLGSCAALSDWDPQSPILMQRSENHFTLSLDLSDESFPIAYKYGVYDEANRTFVCYEAGDNRVLFDTVSAGRKTILHDGFAALPNNTWKGAGIAVPVFSLRTAKSFGTGEFSDIKTLVDWLQKTGIKLVQVLPVNDTTSTHTWTDSYPYSAISAFALHPLYMDLSQLATGALKDELALLEPERVRLNALPALDYEGVTRIKNDFIARAYKQNSARVFKNKAYREYFNTNKHWLVPYAAFCYLRDLYGTTDVNQWPEHRFYDETAATILTEKNKEAIGLYYYTQYHLHEQLREATAYARAHGIVVKGDIPIGVSRNSADAWQDPGLYNMSYQAGAPPDDFAVKGQNWGFPTYNWERMLQDGFGWWKKRFAQMDVYFDAFRIDHILGFFRIWSIPMDAVEGIMGRFVPALPVHITEFNSRGIAFDHARYTKPFINHEVLQEVFGGEAELVKSLFLIDDKKGNFSLKPEFATQRQVEQHFAQLEKDGQHQKIKTGLYDLISNVLLFDAETGNGTAYHFRFHMEHTLSYRYLDEPAKIALKELYVDYFFRRQEVLWRKEALQKLPELKRATEMLVCGEDLGLIPACVPDVMKQVGLLSLEIQRMPKDDSSEFFNPGQAPYLSVVTPSTHDMSTIRGWWEEDAARTQRFFNQQLGQQGEAPERAEVWINKAIILQHLYSPAMWSIFQLQDLLGMDESLRRDDINAERINVPADPKHYWQYRMHLALEELTEANAFNTQLNKFIFASGR